MATDTSTKQTAEQTTDRRGAGQLYRPNVDILETPDELLIAADMPGVKSDGVDIQFEDGVLSINGTAASRNKEVRFRLNEYGIGNFHRTFRVGQQIDTSRISAEMHNGVLKVHLPKAEAAKPKKIVVQAGG